MWSLLFIISVQMALFRKQAKDVDIIITTALIPGKKAPLLILKDMVHSMKPGSVTVDLAAEAGGNVETTVKDDVFVTENVSSRPFETLHSLVTDVEKAVSPLLAEEGCGFETMKG